ncbi:hypothetical protein OA58_05400 [Microcystis aeruginosa NIES-88]|nr:hypothetical protein OA58_05400 [Microcystis aeruginosa NIES-88]
MRFDNVPFRAGLILLQSDFLAGILFPHKSLARQLGELLPPADANMVEAEILKITVMVLMERDQDGHNFA